MNFNYFTTSDKGEFRKSNQDCLYANSMYVKAADGTDTGENIFLGVVCDGMGGLSHGEVASSTVVRAFADWFENRLPEIPRDESFGQNVAVCWQQLITDSNEKLRDIAAQNAQSMGTTLSALLLTENKFYAAQIGDSRVYVGNRNEGFFVPLTTDHSYVADMVAKGLMTAEEARLSNEKNILTRCIGVMKDVQADYYSGDLCGGDYFVICSDGFCSGTLPADIIQNMGVTDGKPLRQGMIENAIANRRAGGERDNITAVLVAVDMDSEVIYG